jgi:hypothetical protein
MKFHENPSSGSRVLCGRTVGQTKMIVAFRNFANAPKIRLLVFTTDIVSSNFVCSSTKLYLSLRRADGYVLPA